MSAPALPIFSKLVLVSFSPPGLELIKVLITGSTWAFKAAGLVAEPEAEEIPSAVSSFLGVRGTIPLYPLLGTGLEELGVHVGPHVKGELVKQCRATAEKSTSLTEFSVCLSVCSVGRRFHQMSSMLVSYSGCSVTIAFCAVIKVE